METKFCTFRRQHSTMSGHISIIRINQRLNCADVIYQLLILFNHDKEDVNHSNRTSSDKIKKPSKKQM
jgi:hypothetical protein